LFNEILVNAFKYYSSETNQSVVLELSECDENQVIICHNPSVKRERTTIKGSGKGHVFLSALASKIGSKFSKPKPQDDFVVEFTIPNELLISN
jgi:two-component sensor histidine kinase